MMTLTRNITIILICAALLSSCGSNENSGNANKTAALTNNTLAMDKLKGAIKTRSEIIYYRALDGDAEPIPADSSSYYAAVYHYDKKGFITKKESYEMVGGTKKDEHVEDFIYKNDVLVKSVTTDKTGTVVLSTTVDHMDNKVIVTTKDGTGLLLSKIITVLDKDYARDSTLSFFYNEAKEVNITSFRDHSFAKDGLPEKDIIIMGEGEGKLTGIENYVHGYFTVVSRDAVGNPGRMFMKAPMPNGENMNMIYGYTYEYYK